MKENSKLANANLEKGNKIREINKPNFVKVTRGDFVKGNVHKEMFRTFKDLVVGDVQIWNGEKLEIKSLADIDKWKELDPKDYKTQYTNAYQRVAYRQRQLKKLSGF